MNSRECVKRAIAREPEFRLRQQRYDDAISVAESISAPLEGGDWSGWRCDVRRDAILDPVPALELRVRFTRIGPVLRSAAVGIELTLPRWSKDHYLAMPAAVYAGNRFPSRRYDYPPLAREPADLGPDAPTVIGDVPRLGVDDGPSRLQLLANDMATPAVGIFDPATRRGLWLLTDLATTAGYTGFVLEENDARTAATLTLLAPGIRAGEHYWFMQMRDKSADRPADFAPGGSVELRLRLHEFDCADIPALYERFMAVRKTVEGRAERRDLLPFSAAWALLEDKQNRENWFEPEQRYRIGDGTNTYSDWQIGWTGGGMATEALLAAGKEETRQRALRTLDFIFTTQTPAGWFHGIVSQGRYPGDGFGLPGTENWLLIRKNADFLYFAMKQLRRLKQTEAGAPPVWSAAVQRLADAFVRLWRQYGQFGQFVDVMTGDLRVGGSTSAGIAPAGLALAATDFGRGEYLDVACAAAEQYGRRDLCAGITTGGPGEIMQSPDSESAFGLLESLVVLYEVTGEDRWLRWARDSANQCASWVTSYDFPFPPASLFGRLNMKSNGTVWANAQNKHASPGICTLSGDSLLKLFRATGERPYLELLHDIAHALPQYVTRPDRPIGKMHPGWINERVNLSDWLEGVGEIFECSCWPECTLILTCTELPGVYAQPDTGLVCAFDHVRAAWRDGRLTLTNPTPFPARVRVLIETAAAAVATPLTAARLSEVSLAPGGEAVIAGNTEPPLRA